MSRCGLQMQGSISDDGDHGDLENENLQMRNWVVNSVLESEKSYIDDLNVLVQVCLFIFLCTYCFLLWLGTF